MSTVVFSIDGGCVEALAGGPLSLADLGPRTTRRASHVEFHAASNLWRVTDALLEPGKVLLEDPDYDVALAWEVDHYNARLGA